MMNTLNVVEVKHFADRDHSLNIVLWEWYNCRLFNFKDLTLPEVRSKHGSKYSGCKLESGGVDADSPFLRVCRETKDDIPIGGDLDNSGIIIQTGVVAQGERVTLSR